VMGGDRGTYLTDAEEDGDHADGRHYGGLICLRILSGYKQSQRSCECSKQFTATKYATDE